MKLKKILSVLVLCSITLFSSCSSDETASKIEFKLIDGTSFSLEGANLYLMSSSTYNYEGGRSFDVRQYYLTDGTYVEGSPWNFSSYTGATFFLEFDLGVPQGNSFKAGKFPLWYNYDLTPAGKNFCYLYLQLDDIYYDYYESYDQESPNSLVVSGGLNGGQTMEIEYKGSLKFYKYISEGEGYAEGEIFTGKLYYKGVVSDERLL